VKSAFEQTASSYADEVYKLGPTAVPPMLYHYTDAAGLLGMLNSGSIWLTDHRFLNDKSELEHTHGTLRELLASKEDQSPSTQAKKLYDAIRLYARTESSQDIHIFSLTEDPDDLSQWRGYAREGLGFTIGFCGLTLREIADPDDAEFSISKIEYDHAKQKSVLDQALTEFERLVTKEVKSKPTKEEEIIDDAASWFDWLVGVRAVANKHSSFRLEREWRLSSLVDKDDLDKDVKVRASGLRLVRYIEVAPRAQGESKLPIKRIGIGPGFVGSEVVDAVRALCKQTDYEHVEIYPADTPYRRI